MTVPDPALVVLIGASGSGKSTWASRHYRVTEIVSSDGLRAVVGSGEQDLDASTDAFALLDAIVAARLRRGLTTVLDTLGLDVARRRQYLAAARAAGLAAVAVSFDVPAALCRARNNERERPVPAPVLSAQLRRMHAVPGELAAEGWDVVLSGAEEVAVEAAHSPGAIAAAAAQRDRPLGLRFVLQVSRFGWDDDPAGWLRTVATTAAEAGFDGLALMDHLIQIPQVGRAWEPILEPWTTLGFVAGLGTGLRLGTLVTPVTFRAPGLLAKTVATLDVLSGGRSFCGIGAGWWDREHAAFGLPFPPAAERLDALEDAIRVVRALCGPGTKPYADGRISLPETTSYPRPLGPVPVIVGGSGERRTLRIAARLGDGCNLPSDPPTLEHKIAVLHALCRAVGRDPAEVAITVLDVPVVGRDRDHAARLVEGLRGRTSAVTFARRHHAGTVSDHIGRYRLLAERGVRTVFVALPDLTGPAEIDRFAAVVAAFD